MSRSVQKRPRRIVCAGDLSSLVTLQNRDIVEPIFGETDFAEEFSGDSKVWAKVVTVAGKTFFDQVNADVALTHEITIRYDPTVTAETWVQAESRRFDIVSVEDLEERHEFMLLRCVERGDTDREAAKS